MSTRPYRAFALAALLVLGAYACPAGARAAQQETGKAREAIIDGHAHLFPGRDNNFDGAARTALKVMKRHGIGASLVMPFPFGPGQRDMFEADDKGFLAAVRRHPGRFVFLAGGGSLNPMIHGAARDKQVSPELRERFRERALALLDLGAAGFGELAAEHFSLGPGHPYLSAPPDHPLFLLLADIAAERGVPIDLHMEALPADLPAPKRLAPPPNPKVFPANMAALERLLAHNRGARIIWDHAGWDNTGQRTCDMMGGLLARHPNLYMSLKINAPNPKESTANRPLDGKGRIAPEWLALLQAYPDRFFLGSDLKYNRPRMGRTEVFGFLEQLPPELARKVGRENARSLFKLEE